MQIKMKKNGTELLVELEGRLDSLSAPELDERLDESYKGIDRLILDLAKLDYISSAGLRVILGASQVMEEQGEMVVRNLTQAVRDVFELVGFDSELKIE